MASLGENGITLLNNKVSVTLKGQSSKAVLCVTPHCFVPSVHTYVLGLSFYQLHPLKTYFLLSPNQFQSLAVFASLNKYCMSVDPPLT